MNKMKSTSIPSPYQHFTAEALLQAYCKLTKLWGLMVHPTGENYLEQLKSCPLFEVDFGNPSKCTPGHMQGLVMGEYYFLYKTEQDMRTAYSFVVGDDGPTENNPYTGPARTFAATCSPEGVLLTCNT